MEKRKVKRKKLTTKTIIIIILISAIVIGVLLFSQPTEPSQSVISKDSVLLLSYSGIPFVFWLLTSLGLMFGLTFHGFKLVSINIKRGDKNENKKTNRR